MQVYQPFGKNNNTMKIINCFWEEENLKRKTCEIKLDASELLPKLEEFTDLCSDYEYQIVKARDRDIRLYKQLSEYGFYLTETQIEVSFDKKGFDKMGHIAKKYIDRITLSYCEDDASVQSTINKITDNLFFTDRIALDPSFNIAIANQRYRNWIKNTIDRNNHHLCKILFGSKEIGFGYFSVDEGFVNYILGGIYPQYQKLGLGISIPLVPIVYMKSENVEKISTHISTNNLNVIRCYIEAGYNVCDIKYVFAKIKDNVYENV